MVAVHELLVTFIGPRSLWVLARVGISADLQGNEVEHLVRSLGTMLEQRSAYIQRVDIVPIGDNTPDEDHHRQPGRLQP